MSAPKHTPGPWRYQREISTRFREPTITRFEVYTDKGEYGHPATCEREEDARLVSAAPTMLDVLRCLQAAIVGHINGIPNDLKAQLDRASAVIATVEGRS